MHGEQQLTDHVESVKQAAVADRIVLTKTDTATREVVERLSARLLALNPGADIHEAVAGEIAPEKLFDTGLYQLSRKTPDVQNWLRAEAYKPMSARGSFLNPPGNTEPNHDARIHAFVVTFRDPIAWHALVDALEMLTAVRGENLLRIKGIVNVAFEKLPRVIHAVQHTIYPAATLAAWPEGDRHTQLVFITRDLDEALIRQTLTSFLAETTPA